MSVYKVRSTVDFPHTLVPVKDCRTAKQVKYAFIDGADFRAESPSAHGTYASIRDVPVGQRVYLRYDKSTKITAMIVPRRALRPKPQMACVVCEADISRSRNRCTNGCCGVCHARFCTDGGATYPGHGINIPEAILCHRAGTKKAR